MRVVSAVIALLLTLSCRLYAAVPSAPDFAFPKTVSLEAYRSLRTAMRAADGQATVRSVMDYALAQGAIDADNVPGSLALIDSVCRVTEAPATRAVLNLLMADIYSQLYNRNRWLYDNREISAEPLPANYDEWSGTQFRQRIIDLVDSSLIAPDALCDMALDTWSSVISCDVDSRPCFPSLYDFVAYKSINLIESTMPGGSPIPWKWMCPYGSFINTSFGYVSESRQRILELYRQLLRYHGTGTPAGIYSDIRRLCFVNDNAYESSSQRLFDALAGLYESCERKSSYSGLVLMEMNGYAGDVASGRRLHSMCRNWLSLHSDGASAPVRGLAAAIVSLQSRLEQQHVTVDFNRVTTDRHPLTVKLSSHNAKKCTMTVYRLPDSYRHGDRVSSLSPASLRKVERVDLAFSGSGIFESDTTVSLAPLVYGNYLISLLLPGQTFSLKTAGYGDVFTVTDLTMQTATFGNAASLIVTNPLTGAPVPDVTLTGLADKRAVTDADGLYRIVQNLDYQDRIYARRGDDRFARPLQLYHHSREQDGQWMKCCNLFTDLAVYHPGDTVRFGGVAYEYYSRTGHDSHIIPDTDVTAVLYNANGIASDTLVCRTDTLGRIYGRFVMPSDGLTGQFRIVVSELSGSSSVSFTVSDYKLPTYELKVTGTLRNVPDAGDVTIEVKAETYSGFPVSGATVDMRLSQSQRYWWRGARSSAPFYTLQAVTDKSGEVRMVLPAQLLKDAPIHNGIFTASLACTSQSGETQETVTSFTRGPGNIISLSIPASMDISPATLRLPVTVSDLSGNVVDIPLTYSLMRDSTVVSKGLLSALSPDVDWRPVKSGVYSITVSAVDSTEAAPVTVSDIVLYRPTDRSMPVRSDLWVPMRSYNVTGSDPARIIYGTSVSDAHIFCTVWSADTVLSQKWIHCDAGLHRLDVDVPAHTDQVTVTLAVVSDFKRSSQEIVVRRTDVPTSLNIEIASFRDRITPGQNEQWTLTVTDNTGNPVSGGVILDMYAKALDVLAPHGMELRFSQPYGNRFSMGHASGFGRESIYCQSKVGRQHYFNVTLPELITYGRSFLPNMLRIRGRMMATGAVFREHKEEIMVEEVAADAGMANMSYAKVYDSAAPMASADMAVAETEVAADDVAADEDRGSADSGEYRMPEHPLAFFHPMLSTDAAGHLEFSFIAPNANTTWRLCAAAFSPELLAGSATREIISSKPVMVQPNLPRFMRSGDSTRVVSSVMNNTDSMAIAVVVTEIFDPVTGAVTATRTDTLALEPKSSDVVSCTLHAPEGASFIGFRTRARVAGFSDGEQSVLPILPAVTPVIETVPFYMQADSTGMTVRIPASGAGSRVTLQLCQNPAWYCVTALPGLRADEGNTSNSAAAAIFSAAIAEGLLDSYPEIGRALREWNTGDRSDSTLVSMLERNQDLKTVLLNATPWMLDARDDTERMTRLALLFDSKEIRRCYSQSIDRLSKLTRKGGWAWNGFIDEPSLWATYNVLSMMGRLRQLGYVPKDKRLAAMTADAVRYIDRQAAETYSRYPESDFTQYAFVRGYFSDIPQSARAKDVTRVTVQRLIGRWRKMELTDKAVAAIILYRNNYKTLSRQIVKSLDQYARTSPQYGMWWPSLDQYYGWNMSKTGATATILDAYALIAPDSRQVDDIRQWLIVQKEAENWGTSVTTAGVIASILTSGSRWIGSEAALTAAVDGRSVDFTSVDRYIGYSRTDISALACGNASVLTISKSGNTPAWGAVYSRFTAPADSVSASGCEAVSIDKRLFIARNTATGVDWVESADYAVGDRVRVQLTVRTTRDMDYVTVIDNRAAAFEPKDQLPAPVVSEGIYFYQENRDASTRMFVRHLPKGTYVLTYDLSVNNAGRFASGIATVQSQYAPQLAAHSSGHVVTVRP